MNDITTSMAAATMLKPYLADSGHEELWILVLKQLSPILPIKINTGGLESVEIDFKHIIKEIILNDGDAVIIFHNHPSCNPQPSSADIKMTEKLRNALDLMDIRLIDHIILTAKEYFSFADEQVKKYISQKQTRLCSNQQ